MKKEKGSGLRFLELFDSLKIISDSLKSLSQGKNYQIKTMSGQLRAILIADRWNPEPLFYEVSNNIGINLKLYLPSILTKQNINENILVYKNLFNIKFSNENTFTKEIDLKNWLELPIVEMPNRCFSIKDIIKLVADKNGGAHYDKKLDLDSALLCSINMSNGLLIDLLIRGISITILKIGLRIIKNVFDFHFFLSFAIKVNDKNCYKNILKYKNDEGYVPVAISVEDNNLMLNISDFNNKAYKFVITENINSGHNIISFSNEIDIDFNSKLTIYNSSGKKDTHHFDNPLFIYKVFIKFKDFWVSDDGVFVGLYALMQFSKVLEKHEMESVFDLLNSQKKEHYLFRKLTHGCINNDGSMVFDSSKEDDWDIMNNDDWLNT